MPGPRIGPNGEMKLKKLGMKPSLRAGLWTLAILLTLLSLVSAKPTEIKRQKRQSDQRVAELQTIFGLRKYGQNPLRGWSRGRDLAQPGFDVIDFDRIGRKKKSTRFSPGDEGKVWSATWVLPLTSSEQQFETRSSGNSLDSQVDQN